jgi:hypothetical protein
VVTWGQPSLGSDTTAVQNQLRDVTQICHAAFAFAAISGNGTVFTWGDPEGGGDSSAAQHQFSYM